MINPAFRYTQALSFLETHVQIQKNNVGLMVVVFDRCAHRLHHKGFRQQATVLYKNKTGFHRTGCWLLYPGLLR